MWKIYRLQRDGDMIMSKIKFNLRYLLSFIAIFIIEVFIAVYVHDNFIRPYIGDVFVVILIYCFLRIFLPPYRFLPLGIFLFAVAVEFSQLFNLAELLGVLNNRILSIVLGSTFDISDIICYAVGCLLVCLWQYRNYIKRIIKKFKS